MVKHFEYQPQHGSPTAQAALIKRLDKPRHLALLDAISVNFMYPNTKLMCGRNENILLCNVLAFSALSTNGKTMCKVIETNATMKKITTLVHICHNPQDEYINVRRLPSNRGTPLKIE